MQAAPSASAGAFRRTCPRMHAGRARRRCASSWQLKRSCAMHGVRCLGARSAQHAAAYACMHEVDHTYLSMRAVHRPPPPPAGSVHACMQQRQRGGSARRGGALRALADASVHPRGLDDIMHAIARVAWRGGASSGADIAAVMHASSRACMHMQRCKLKASIMTASMQLSRPRILGKQDRLRRNAVPNQVYACLGAPHTPARCEHSRDVHLHAQVRPRPLTATGRV